MRRVLHALRAGTRGATTIEYALIISMIILVMIVALNLVATSTIDMWNHVETEIVG